MSMTTTTALGHALTYRRLRVRTPDEVWIDAQDWGSPGEGRDVLFIHGFSQSHLCWLRQVTSPLRQEFRLVTYDNRGHGHSDKPSGDGHYRDPRRWADEVKAVIEAAQMDRPVLVAWSYGGRIALDYLSIHGSAGLGGLIMVSATSSGNPSLVGPAGALLGRMGDTDLQVASENARGFLEQCTYGPLPIADFQFMEAYTALTPTAVRRGLTGRPAGYDDVLRSITVPMLVIHGQEDRVILPEMAMHTQRCVPHARSITYSQTGHAPFWEADERFNEDVATFLRTGRG